MPLKSGETVIDAHGRDLARHGSALLPIACYEDDVNRLDIPWHWHVELEAVVVTRGRAILTAGAERYLVGEGEGVFINSGVLHTTRPLGEPECQVRWTVFHPRLVGGSLDSVFWADYVQPLMNDGGRKGVHFDGSAPWHGEAVRAVEAAWRSCVEEPPGYEFQIRGALSELVFLLTSHRPAEASRPSGKALREEERIKVMLQYIQEHYASPLSTAAIARSAMVSESECLRCFRSVIGTPPVQYVKQFRLQKAAELLVSTSWSVSEIGAQCGYEDASYFTKTFREEKGVTPSAYRESHR